MTPFKHLFRRKLKGMYYPSFKDFKKKAREGNLIPVYREIYADMETPVSAFLKIDESKFSFLFESVEGGEKWGRYSFLGTEPSLIFKSKGKEVTIISENKSRTFKTDRNPLGILKEIMDKFRPVKIRGLPRFFGGAVGFLSYDFVDSLKKYLTAQKMSWICLMHTFF